MSAFQISKLIPMLYTQQVPETIRFYHEALGFTCNSYEENWGWASLGFGEIEIMLSVPNVHLPFDRPGFTGSFYFHVHQVDELWQRVQGKAEIVYPIEDFEYGMREFAIKDNNGYILQFGHELSVEIKE